MRSAKKLFCRAFALIGLSLFGFVGLASLCTFIAAACYHHG